MNKLFSTVGEQQLMIELGSKKVEAIVLTPENKKVGWVAILGHPHSLHGGSMNNKVVTTLARCLRDLGVPSIRFNFRGVGKSEGVFDNGVGEAEDFTLLYQYVNDKVPEQQYIFAGFSFGSYVSYRAALDCKPALLISIAPSVENFNYQQSSIAPSPWLCYIPMNDEVVSADAAIECFETLQPKPKVTQFADTSHFFHGQLVALKQHLQADLNAVLEL